MSRRSLLPILLISAAAALGGFQPIMSHTASAQQGACQTFKQTGKQVCGKFLQYWQAHGGLMRHGFPISDQFTEKSDVDGKTYTVQYFERSEFELHPDNAGTPYEVLLSLLGTYAYNARYAKQPPPKIPHWESATYFPQTGHYLGGRFLEYWNSTGGLSQYGYPLTDQFQEVSSLNGKTYTVQYFERAVFELHTENQPPFDVLLSQLGTIRYKQRYSTALRAGNWGGDHIGMFVKDSGATLEFDCAHGSIDQPLAVDAKGHFDAAGVYVREHGGPVRQGELEDSHPARYTGVTDGKTMTITITVTDQNLTMGTYVLFYGQVPKIMKCL